MKHIKLFEQFIAEVNEARAPKTKEELISALDDAYAKLKKYNQKYFEIDLATPGGGSWSSNSKEGKAAFRYKKMANNQQENIWKWTDKLRKLGFEYNSTNESIVDEGITSETDYIYKEDSGAGKATWVLKLGPESWQKVKHLFDKEGRPTQELTKIPAAKSLWSLYVSSYPSDNKEMHKIYGVSGDFTFGNAPTFYQQKHRGNKKAAKEVFDWFIKTYLN